MKVTTLKIGKNDTPLFLTGSLGMTGGSGVQFYDGQNYIPNREGTPASPVILDHNISIINPDEQFTGAIVINKTTKFYENNVLITSTTPKYTLLGQSLRVEKNVPVGQSITIMAVSSFVDPRSGKVYERSDVTYLRTLSKTEGQKQLTLSQRELVYFDGWRNPNTTTDVTATIEDLTSYAGITFKWLNGDGLDVMENELYADKLSADNRTLTVDKTYIDKETITCEAWKDGAILATDTVTFYRLFSQFESDMNIPEIPVMPGVTELNCTFTARDHKGPIDVNSAFLCKWMLKEGSSVRELATGTPAKIPVSSINFNNSPEIYVEVFRREAWAAIEDQDGYILVDDDDAILTIETYGV